MFVIGPQSHHCCSGFSRRTNDQQFRQHCFWLLAVF